MTAGCNASGMKCYWVKAHNGRGEGYKDTVWMSYFVDAVTEGIARKIAIDVAAIEFDRTVESLGAFVIDSIEYSDVTESIYGNCR